jgi:hypothetical protein
MVFLNTEAINVLTHPVGPEYQLVVGEGTAALVHPRARGLMCGRQARIFFETTCTLPHRRLNPRTLRFQTRIPWQRHRFPPRQE